MAKPRAILDEATVALRNVQGSSPEIQILRLEEALSKTLTYLRQAEERLATLESR